MNNFFLTSKRGLAVAVLVATGMNLFAALHSVAAAPTISIVAATGTTTTVTGISGSPATGTFLAFSAPNLDSTGDAAFNASIVTSRGGPVTTANNFGNWTGTSSSLSLVSQIGTHAPLPTGTATFGTYVNVPFYNDAGQVAFGATLKIIAGQATLYNYTGVWSSSSGSLTLVARKGSAVPVSSGTTTGTATFSTFLATGLSDDNTIVVGTLNLGGGVTAANNQGIWEGTQESDLTQKLRTGTTVTDTLVTPTDTLTVAAPLTYYSASTLLQGQGRAFADNTGDIALLTGLTKGGAITSGIVTSFGGTEAVLTRIGDPAPGMTFPTGTTTSTSTFTKLGSPMINSSDDIAFTGSAAIGRTITTANNIGIWTASGGIVSSAPLYRIGQAYSITDAIASPSTASTATLTTLSDPLFNDNGAVAFAAAVTVGNLARTTLFCDSGSTGTRTLTAYAQVGMQAPGCPTGVKFYSFTTMALANGGGATGLGRLVFQATLSGPGVYAANNVGIWAVDNSGVVQLIQRTGTTVSVGTTSKKIAGLYLSSFTKASATTSIGVSKGGDVGFSALFSDYTGATYLATF